MHDPKVISRPIEPRPKRVTKEEDVTRKTNERPTLANLVVALVLINTLSTPARRLRKPSPKKVARLVALIARWGLLKPILVTAAGEIVDGELTVLACKELKIERIPAVVIDGFSGAEIKAIRLSLNRTAEGRQWIDEALSAEFSELLKSDPTLFEFAGFDPAEIDRFLTDFTALTDDDDPEQDGPIVSRLGDLWISFDSKLKILCGNSRDGEAFRTLLLSETAQMVLTDPPYGCRIEGHVSRSHGEFVEGSGMSRTEAFTFFLGFLNAMTPYLDDGAIVDMFIDGAGMLSLMQAIQDAGLEQKVLVCWDKCVGAMGSLYRHQAEFVLVTKWGAANHINNVQLGKHKRNRTTVWSVPGLAQAGRGREQALALHPTIKPVAMLMDAILDTSLLGGIVLDPFAGTGSTLIAAHRTQRTGRGIELDPKYVDAAVARLERVTGKPMIHAETGLTFAEMACKRSSTSGSVQQKEPQS